MSSICLHICSFPSANSVGINIASSENLARPENRLFVIIIGVCALIFYYFEAGFVRLVPSRFGFPEYDLDLSSHLQFQDLLVFFTILSIVGKIPCEICDFDRF